MYRFDAGVEAFFLGGLDLGGRGALAAAFVTEGGEGAIFLRGGRGKGMIGGDGHERGTEQRVGPGGENLQFGVAGGGRLRVERPADQQALGATDPVFLHHANLLRPSVEGLQGFQQLVGVAGDPEGPLLKIALFDDGAGAPAAAIDDLLVGQNSVVDGVPIDLRRLAVDQAGLEHIEEQALLVDIVRRVTRRDLAGPIQRQSHGFQLRLHGGDIVVGPFAWVDAALEGGVLCSEPEGVPTHRVQNVESLGFFVTRQHIAHGVIADVAHMDPAGRIGEHFEDVALWLCGIGRGFENATFVPVFLPEFFACGGVVAFSLDGHRWFALGICCVAP